MHAHHNHFSEALQVLTLDQVKSYETNGFLVIDNFIPSSICHSLREHASQLIESFDDTQLRVIFSAVSQKHEADHYFLNSGDKIRFFFEENAFDAEGRLQKPKSLAINKIGHALHDLDPQFYCFSRLHKIAELTKDLGIIDPLLLQSMYICKQPQIGGEVKPHQDATFMSVEGGFVTGLWFALEDATRENGCLWAIPGGHRTPLKSRLFREGTRTFTEVYDNTPWSIDRMIPIEVTQGSVVVLHGLLPHMSEANHSNQSRHAYTLHVASTHHHYSPSNWLQRPHTGFSSFID